MDPYEKDTLNITFLNFGWSFDPEDHFTPVTYSLVLDIHRKNLYNFL